MSLAQQDLPSLDALSHDFLEASHFAFSSAEQAFLSLAQQALPSLSQDFLEASHFAFSSAEQAFLALSQQGLVQSAPHLLAAATEAL